MKIATILFIVGLVMPPVIGLAQTSEIQSSSTQSVPTAAQEEATVFPPKTAETQMRCEVQAHKLSNECGNNLYRNIYAQCSDGSEFTLGDATSCQSDEIWIKLANDACAGRCPNNDVFQSLEKPIMPPIPETAMPAPTPVFEKLPIPEKPIITPTTAATLLGSICGVSTFKVYNECGAGVYKNIYAQCYDGFAVNLGETTSCKPAELWEQYAKEACTKHCSKAVEPTTISAGVDAGIASTPASTPIYYYKETTEGGNRYTPLGSSSVPIGEQEWVSVCTTIDRLTQNYNETVLELQKQEALSNKEKIEDLTRSLENLKKYTEDAKKICSTDPQMAWQVGAPPKGIKSTPIYTQESKPVSAPTKPVEIPKATPVCYIGDYLFQKYNQLIIELQKSESDKARTELITKEIIALKQQISTQQKECVNTAPQQISKIIQPAGMTQQLLTENKPIAAIENKPVAVAIDRCNEVEQWETKIVYYKKLGNLNEGELKKNGFSREEIEKILQELSLGIEKVRAQCTSQEKTPVITKATAITGSVSIAETVRPVVIGSGQEIGTYYKARLEKAVSIKAEDKQIEELKTLRGEIDGLISNLIKSRKELEVSELNGLVKEVKVSRGEIKADDISVKTTEKKMIVSVGNRPVSIEPTENQVLIRDKALEVNTNEVTIKENVLNVGGVDVKMSASAVSEKLGFTPTTIELKEENAKAVYNIKIDERRKLFGFIPLNIQRAVAADAENGNILSEHLPWYNFLTTK